MGIVRKTKSIELLLHEFKTQTTAISTVELIKRLNSKLNKTTIYRVLENLVDDGFLHFSWVMTGSSGMQCVGIVQNPHMRIYILILNVLNVYKINCLNTEVIIPKIQNHKILSSQILIQGH